MKITKTTTRKETTEIEVTLPYFSKDNNYYYCVLAKNQVIKVDYKEYTTLPASSGINTGCTVSDAFDGEKITQKEFEDIFVKVSDFHADLFETMRDTIRERKHEVYDNVTINGKGEESL